MSSAPHGEAPSGKLPTGDVSGKPSECSRSQAPKAWRWSQTLALTPPTSNESMGHEESAKLQRLPGSHASPHGNFRPSAPRAARSHSASVGSASPTHSQKAVASSHETLT